MVLTESAAERYFGESDPIGRTLTYDGEQDFQVTGVIADPSEASHFHFDLLASYASLELFMPWTQQKWHWPPIYTYLKLAPETRSSDLAAQLPAFILEHGGEEQAAQRSLALQRVRDIHLHSQRNEELSANGDIAYVYLFSAIALLILATACINFVNLTTALAGDRSREVGVRKALGAQRTSLIRQFLLEASAQVVVAMVLALAFVEILIPTFSAVSGKSVHVSFLDLRTIVIVLTGIVVVGLSAGFYPAFLLSGFRPVRALKGVSDTPSLKPGKVRSGLVVFQFMVSAAMISSTAVIFAQLDYVRQGKTGFDEEHTLVMELHDSPDRARYDLLKTRLLDHPNVIDVTASSSIPPGRGFSFNYPIVPEGHSSDEPVRMRVLGVDTDFVDTFGLTLADGRDFSTEYGTDSANAFLMNQTAARNLGWDDAAVGKELTLSYDNPNEGFTEKTGRVIGVLEDFHFASFHHEIEPILVHLLPPSVYSRFVAVRVRPDDIPETIDFVKTEWEAFSAAGYPFNYTFLDQAFDQEYRADEQLGDLAGYFSILAVLIACLGLLGLAAFTAKARTKEIGIRKVLGASAQSIFGLLSTGFLKPVAIGFIVAAPLVYASMGQWLENFAYHITIGPGVFVLTAILLAAVTILSISYQSVKAAFSDPVDALRYE